ncbi:MAG: hypothetical protein ACO3JL_02510 [Myxococcota bacterium]
MKRMAIALLLVLIAGGAYVGAAHFSGGVFPTPGIELGGARGDIRRQVDSFLEDIQYKDFKSAARYHAPELRDEVDIPFLLQRLFTVKPEALDIMSWEIIAADIDSTGRRGRVRARVKVKELLQGNLRDQEMMFYFHQETPDGAWYMKLEDSLRHLSPEQGKKH